jgi:hypothetical protein
MNAPEDELEPAQHDHPDGPVMGWNAGELAPEDLSTDADVAQTTTLAADGGIPDDDPEAGE